MTWGTNLGSHEKSDLSVHSWHWGQYLVRNCWWWGWGAYSVQENRLWPQTDLNESRVFCGLEARSCLHNLLLSSESGFPILIVGQPWHQPDYMQEQRSTRGTSHSAWEKVSALALPPRISQWMLVPVTWVLYTHNRPEKCLSPQFTDEHADVQGSVNKPAHKHVPRRQPSGFQSSFSLPSSHPLLTSYTFFMSRTLFPNWYIEGNKSKWPQCIMSQQHLLCAQILA